MAVQTLLRFWFYTSLQIFFGGGLCECYVVIDQYHPTTKKTYDGILSGLRHERLKFHVEWFLQLKGVQ